MRKYTFALSLVAHALLIGSAIAVPIFATGDLPEVSRSSAFVLVTIETPDVPPAPSRAEATRTVNAGAAPVVEPDGLTPERPVIDSGEPGIVNDVVAGPGGIPGVGVSGHGVIAPPPPPAERAPVRTGGDVRPPQKTHHVAPVYPSIARSARVSGTVILEAVIAEDGRVEDVRVLRSIALLDEAAIEAVRQWRFTPTLLNGRPVRVLMTVTVSFTLN